MANTRWLDSTHALSAGAWTDSDEFRVVASGNTGNPSEKRLPSALITYLQGKSLAFTVAQTIKKDSIGTTSTDGWILSNLTNAAAGAQQYSPRIRWTGQGWKTNATAASQSVDFIAEVRPVQGAANPTGYWTLAKSINGASFTSVLSVRDDGFLIVGDNNFPNAPFLVGNVFGVNYANTGIVSMTRTTSLGWGTSVGAVDTILTSDAANTLGLRNAGTAGTPVPQAFNIYNFCATVATDAEWGYAKWVSNVFRIGTAAAVGTGSVRNVIFDIGGVNKLDYGITTASTWTFASSIAASSIQASSAAYIYWGGRASMSSPSDGVVLLQNNASTDFSRVQFGGTTSSFPALARSGVNIIIQGADASAVGGLGIGGADPSTNTFLKMAVGTTAKAQVNWGTTSVAPTSPNNGDMWFDGTDLKIRIGGATKTVTVI